MIAIKRISPLTLLLATLLLLPLHSCIENDIPYPVRPLSITQLWGEGFTTASIDETNRVVTLALSEQCDIQRVVIDSVTYTDGATPSTPLVGSFDLRTPIHLTLSQYQEYAWSVVAEQTIERYFTLSGQSKAAIIDAQSRTITAYMPEGRPLDSLSITSIKLGAAGITTLSPLPEEITNFSDTPFRYIYATTHGRTERWKIVVKETNVKVSLTQCDVWATQAWLAAAGESSKGCGFNYRKVGDVEWHSVPQEQIEVEVGGFFTQLAGLTPSTPYEFQAVAGVDLSPVVAVTTEATPTLPNGDFEQWYKAPKPWFPYLDGGAKFWDTGNTGATTIGESYNLTTPSTEVRPNSKGSYSAQLQSRYVLVKFAAGNLFTGRYVKTAGTSGGIVGFGQPFTGRPTALRGWLKYRCGTIDRVDKIPPGVTIEANKTPDVGTIYIALGNWTAQEYGTSSFESEVLGTAETPIIVDTRDPATFFSPTSPAVIAYGELLLGSGEEEWREFTLPLNYTTTATQPTHLVICCSASRYGDYFTGSTQSALWVDDFELIYE